MTREKLNTISFNDSVRQYWIRTWVHNAVKNWPHLQGKFEQHHAELLIGSITKTKKEPAIVLGAGPSLDLIAPIIGNWQGTIFAPNSLCHWMDAIGRHAEYVCAIDTSEEIGSDLKGPHYYRTSLLTHPCVDPAVFETWKGPLKIFRMFEPGNEVINTLFASLYPWISGYVVNSGCIGNSMVLLASLLGYSPLFIIGIDYSYPEGRMRFQDFKYRGHFVYLPKSLEMVNRSDRWEAPQLLESDEGVLTTRTNIFYKQTFLCNYKLTGMQVINMSPVSILKPELPFAPVEEVVARQGQGFKKLHRSRRQIDEIVDNYLVPRGIYAKYHEKTGGIAGIEIVGELPRRLQAKKLEVERLTKDLEDWSFPTPDKPYFMRKDVTLTKIPDWEWEEESEDSSDSAMQDGQFPLSGQDPQKDTGQIPAGTVPESTSAVTGGTECLYGSAPDKQADSSDNE